LVGSGWRDAFHVLQLYRLYLGLIGSVAGAGGADDEVLLDPSGEKGSWDTGSAK
jgi:hypothetical protein